MSDGIDPTDGSVVARQTLDDSRDAPATQIVETIATLEGVDPTELSPVYGCADDLVTDLLSSPPSSEADATLEFTYQGYRVHVRQDGVAVISHPME
ncbi:HalOD1 output domain-containing protein [Natrialba swarupiae]|uniref:Halobacterial output domain-containing protein n=1 Tax=Natrialba swarupiae TaxID=2448032 RepID=A0A5D5AHJ2_9EURY|nr:HalOD1 output domain-containing protein [Natrialba swarupiae]MCW8172318.1 hypothetical protein [Natrialba swarupiae]TYT61196.1 hypothetical protein FYC77_14850 [Natrialba swarupiae]